MLFLQRVKALQRQRKIKSIYSVCHCYNTVNITTCCHETHFFPLPLPSQLGTKTFFITTSNQLKFCRCRYRVNKFLQPYLIFMKRKNETLNNKRGEGLDLHRLLALVHNSCCYATMQHLMTSFCNIWWHHFVLDDIILNDLHILDFE